MSSQMGGGNNPMTPAVPTPSNAPLSQDQLKQMSQGMQSTSPSAAKNASPSSSWDSYDNAIGKTSPTSSSTIGARMSSDIQGAGSNISDAIHGTGSYQDASIMNRASGAVASAFNTPLKMASDILPQGAKDTLSSVNDTLSNYTTGGVNADSVSKFLGLVSDKVSDIKPLQTWAANNPQAVKSLTDALGTVSNIGQTAGDIAAIGGVSDAAISGAGQLKNAVGEMATPKVDSEGVASTPTLSPEAQSTVDGRVKTLNNIELNSASPRRVSTAATSKGIDVKNLVSNTDLLQGTVDSGGKINTLEKGGAVDQFNQFMSKYESTVSDGLSKEGISIPMGKVQQAFNAMVNESGVAGASKTRLVNQIKDEISGLNLDANPNGSISLSKLQDAKISTNNGIDYTKPETKINAKAIANTYKTLIESNSKLPVKTINQELSKYYSIGDYLESLNGKTVKGGRLGKYFAQTVGAVAGSHFGPLGTIIGSELGGLVKGSVLENTFGSEIGQGLKASPALEGAVNANNQAPLQLTAPQTQENNLGNLNNAQTTNTMKSNASMPNSTTPVTPKSQGIIQSIKNTPNKQGGFIDFGKIAQSLDNAKRSIMLDFLNKPTEYNSYYAQKIAQQMGLPNAFGTNNALKNDFVKVLDADRQIQKTKIK